MMDHRYYANKLFAPAIMIDAIDLIEDEKEELAASKVQCNDNELVYSALTNYIKECNITNVKRSLAIQRENIITVNV